MKVILEGQLLTGKYIRGMNCYAKSLINALIRRGKNEYAITVFDCNRERGNREKIISHLDNPDVSVYECSSLSYRDLMHKENPFPQRVTYQSCTGAYGDVYHFMTQQVLPPGLDGKTVITVHDLIPLIMPDLCDDATVYRTRQTWRRIQAQRPLIITDSGSTKNDVLNFDSSLHGKVFAVPLSHQEDELYPDVQPQLLREFGIDSPYILYLGAIDAHKGADTLIRAFEIVAGKISDTDLVLAGAMRSESVKKAIAMSRFAGRIKCPGTVDNTIRRVLYSGAEVFVFPSLYEGFGLPVLEAMACGAPVITSNTGSLPEVAGDAAVFVSPADAGQLACEMERVLTSEPLRDDMRAKGFGRCKQFSWDKTAELTEEVYKVAYESNT